MSEENNQVEEQAEQENQPQGNVVLQLLYSLFKIAFWVFVFILLAQGALYYFAFEQVFNILNQSANM